MLDANQIRNEREPRFVSVMGFVVQKYEINDSIELFIGQDRGAQLWARRKRRPVVMQLTSQYFTHAHGVGIVGAALPARFPLKISDTYLLLCTTNVTGTLLLPSAAPRRRVY